MDRRGMGDSPVGSGTGSTGWWLSHGLVQERLLGSESDGRGTGRVLLPSGCETLDSCKQVCRYSAGTNTSPIFLFSKVAIEGAASPTPSVQPGGEGNFRVGGDGGGGSSSGEGLRVVADSCSGEAGAASRQGYTWQVQQASRAIRGRCSKPAGLIVAVGYQSFSPAIPLPMKTCIRPLLTCTPQEYQQGSLSVLWWAAAAAAAATAVLFPASLWSLSPVLSVPPQAAALLTDL
ncbi:hypothetical protein O3P69_007850 [Scylla paramamosain]|uniref:Uncharacterized protein n=1 Tax=Scylla paramamosain TaxID=85552 RepID=A0AAW0SII3_SCYPA